MSDDAQTFDTPQAVSLAALPVGELIMVETRNSQYRVVLTDPQDGRARIEGGSAFPEPAEVRVVGATSGAGFLKPGSINVGLGMEILTGDHYLVTSAVRSIHLMHRSGQRRRAAHSLGSMIGQGPDPVKPQATISLDGGDLALGLDH